MSAGSATLPPAPGAPAAAGHSSALDEEGSALAWRVRLVLEEGSTVPFYVQEVIGEDSSQAGGAEERDAVAAAKKERRGKGGEKRRKGERKKKRRAEVTMNDESVNSTMN